MKNKFVIMCCSYNNEEWVDTHIESILEQTYTNYEVVYVNDASTDNTLEMVTKLVGNDKRFHIINNPKNLDSPTNYFTHTYDFMKGRDDDILVELCGDDWFATPDVLEKLNDVYNQTDCWLTYGGMRVWTGGENIVLPNPQNSEYHPFVHQHSLYRRDAWRAGHLHSFRWFIHKQVEWDDVVSRFDNEIFKAAIDLQLQFSVMEMTPPEKIINLDFPTVVFNGEPNRKITLKDGTFRASQENEKYEVEVRNKKKFKRVSSREELKREKLPQVNTPSDMAEICSIPTKFSYCFNQLDGDFDMLLLNDGEILDYMSGKIKINKNVPVVVRLHEQRDYFQGNLMKTIIDNHNMFDTILTFDKIILDSVPNARFCNADGITQFVIQPNAANIPAYHSQLYDNTDINQTIKIYEKTNFDRASCITSTKSFLPGHTTRLNFVKNIKDKVDLYGRGIREIPSKLDALHNYAFSVGIENNTSVDDYYFTEKLLECFVTGTIPIYHGCPNIDKYFDMNGILTFSTQQELDDILNSLSEEKYNSMLDSVKNNFNTTIEKFVLHNDSLYELHLKEILEKNK